MLEKNKEFIIEAERLEKGAFTGQTTIHWLKGIVKIIEWPKKPVRKEINRDNKIGGTENG